MCEYFRRPCCLCRDIAVAIAMCVTTSGTARCRCDVTLSWRGTPIQPKYKTLTRQKLNFHLNPPRITVLYFTLGPMYGFDHISLSSSQSDKCFRQNLYRKSTPIMFDTFFSTSYCLRDNVQKYRRAGQATYGNMADTHSMLNT
jgi:hypothetical protein